MAKSTNDILFRWLADTKSLQSGTRRARGDLKDTEKSAGKTAAAMGGMQKAFIAAGGAMVIREVGQFATDAARMAETAEIVSGSFDKIFQESAPALRESLEKTRLQVGLNSLEFEQLLLKTGLLLDGFGATSEEATEFASAMFKASADMAAFVGDAGATDEALHALNRALVGEFDPLEQFVGGIKASTVAEEALRLGLKKTTKELTNQDKATALLSLVSKNASSSVGALAEQEGTLAANTAEANAKFDDLKIKLGRSLIGPVSSATKVLLELADTLEVVGDESLSGVDKLDQLSQKSIAVTDAINPLTILLDNVHEGFFNWKNGIEAVEEPLKRFRVSVAQLDGNAENAAAALRDLDAAERELNEETETSIWLADLLAERYATLIARSGELADKFIQEGRANPHDSRTVEGPQPKQPASAQGGTIQPGATHLVGEKGPELFTPRGGGHVTPSHMSGGNSGGGVTINVEFSGVVGDPTAVAEQIQDLLEQYTRTNVAF